MSDSEFIYQFLLNSAKHYMEEEEKNNLNINKMNEKTKNNLNINKMNEKTKKKFINYMEHEGFDGLEYFCDILTDQIVNNNENTLNNEIKYLENKLSKLNNAEPMESEPSEQSAFFGESGMTQQRVFPSVRNGSQEATSKKRRPNKPRSPSPSSTKKQRIRGGPV